MTDAQAYRATLDRLQKDLADTEAHANKLRAAITVIRALVNPNVVLPPLPMEAQDYVPSDGVIHAGMTMKDAAMVAFRSRPGEPMKVRELFDAMRQLGYKYEKEYEVFRGSMTPTLDRQPEFTRVSPGLYMLTEDADARTAQGAGSTLGRKVEQINF